MIIGIGIDIVKTEKIKSVIERLGKDFLERVFNQKELDNIYKGKMYYQRLAARFAAKEAIIKALSKKIPLALKDIFILNKANGAPYCELKKKIDVEIFLSITHIEEYAVACAVAQQK
ncbi:MAG: holo-ACP synthase [Candidatus Omnitrophica bacterium]|nr:holo-ACP synthase [Candidatus Omnitrophota bacterium]MCM8830669.1 holo-ACP synthase [Candidatus Omnitrophota bacterium]